MSLQTPETVGKLQSTLHAKAKEAPGYRFYALYDKVYREDILSFAYRLSRRNGGSRGVDGESFASIESSGREAWLGVLTQPRVLNSREVEFVVDVSGAAREETAAFFGGEYIFDDGHLSSDRDVGVFSMAVDEVVNRKRLGHRIADLVRSLYVIP